MLLSTNSRVFKFKSSVEMHNFTAKLKINGVSFRVLRKKKTPYTVEVLENTNEHKLHTDESS